MSIEIHNPHLVNSLVADAERRTLRAFPGNQSSAKEKSSAALESASSHPVAVSSHQYTAETKLKVCLLYVFIFPVCSIEFTSVLDRERFSDRDREH